MGLNEAVQEGVEVVEGETAVHPTVCSAWRAVPQFSVGVLGPGQVLCILPEVLRVISQSDSCNSYRLEVAG